MTRLTIGHWGEEMAARHLSRLGWTVRERNLRVGRKEVDLVAEKNDVLAFIEVKTRTEARYDDALAAIAPRKQRMLQQAAERWIAANGPLTKPFRFDAIAVTGRPGQAVRVQHVVNAWGV